MMEPNDALMPSILDREVTERAADAFGHADFSRSLRSLVESSRHAPPYSVGLLGGWGTGKSTVKALYLEDLREDATKAASGRTRQDLIFPITFNAWRYGGGDGDIKRSLLRHVFLALGGDDTTLQHELRTQVTRALDEGRSAKRIFRDLGIAALKIIVPTVVIMAALGWAISLLIGRLHITNDWAKAFAIAGISAAVAAVAKYALEGMGQALQGRSTGTRIELPRSSSEEYEDLLLRQLHRFKEAKAKGLERQGKNCERVVIFVDDLDRLSAEDMVDGLDAIRTFMETPVAALPKGLGVVFVISCDEGRISDALTRRRHGKDMPGAVGTDPESARRFLDRIFQFRLEIPPFPKQDMRDYVLQRFNADAPALAREVESRCKSDGKTLADLVTRMIHPDVDNPRNAIQILNAFIQAWWVAERREHEGTASDRAGGIQEGVVTGHPLTIGIIAAIRVNFPELYEDLVREPDLLQRWFGVLFRGEEITNLPERTQEILGNYFELSDSSKPCRRTLRRSCKKLYPFLASIRTLRLPDDLQPFLLLNQDRLTRKYGAKATAVRRGLLSGDTIAVLEALGRQHDARLMTKEDVRLIQNLWEDLAEDTVTARDNAGIVLADLAPRLPDSDAYLVVDQLCSQMSESGDLRWRVGVKRIGGLLPKAGEERQRQVAQILVSDLLQLDSQTPALLESLQKPSLTEATEMARLACEVVLDVRSRCRLDETADRRLLDWLPVRPVAISGRESTSLPFSDLQDWMASHEEHLLMALREQYTALVIAELQAERDIAAELPVALQRVRIVLDDLWIAGEDDRPTMWEQISQLAECKAQEAVELAWDRAGHHLAEGAREGVAQLCSSLAVRLGKEMQDDDTWPLDREAGARKIVAFAGSRKDAASECSSELSSLASAYLATDGTAAFGTALLDVLMGVDPSAGGEAIVSCISQLPDKLPEKAAKWIGSSFSDPLNAEQRGQVVQAMQPCHAEPKVSEDAVSRLKWILETITDEGLATAEMVAFLNSVSSQLPARHNDPDGYLRRVFPVLVELFGRPVPPGFYVHLQQLFVNAKASIEILGWLHDLMADHWPQPVKKAKQYAPAQLFDEAAEVAQSTPANEGTRGVIKSMASMLRDGLVDDVEGRSSRLLKLALQIWPHYRDPTASVLMSLTVSPSGAEIANLMDPIDVSKQDEFKCLQAIWTHWALAADAPTHEAALRGILAKPAKGTEAEPDLCLGAWLDASKQSETLLESGLLDTALSDSQLHRLWQQVTRLPGLSPEFFGRVLPSLVGSQKATQVLDSVLESLDEIQQRFSSQTDRSKLAKAALDAFLACRTREGKVRLANWLKDLGGESHVREYAKGESKISDDDAEVLASMFPAEKRLLTKQRQEEKVDGDV